MQALIGYLFNLFIVSRIACFAVPALWSFRKLTTVPYAVGSFPIELTKYAQKDFLSRVMIRVFGNLNTGVGAAGTATGKDNPEGLLIQATLQTQPLVASAVPINQVSGRGLRWDAAINRGFLVNPTAIADGGGVEAVDWTYELTFKRSGVRKSIEYALDMSKYTSLLLTLTFGDQTQLFTGSANTWNLTALNIEIYVDSSFSVDPDGEHAHELFEVTYPILQAQSDFPINQLPPGWLYTDMYFLAEDNNALSNNVINNIDIEGGGRTWTMPGDNNAKQVQRDLTVPDFDGSVGLGNLVGVHAFSMKDGMYSRQIDALQNPIIVKLNVNGPPGGHAYQVRLVGRRLVPFAVYRKQKAVAAGAGKKA